MRATPTAHPDAYGVFPSKLTLPLVGRLRDPHFQPPEPWESSRVVTVARRYAARMVETSFSNRRRRDPTIPFDPWTLRGVEKIKSRDFHFAVDRYTDRDRYDRYCEVFEPRPLRRLSRGRRLT